MTGRGALRSLAVLALLAGAACRSDSSPPPPPAASITPVTLPDLATAPAPLQQLVRQRYAALERARTSATSDAERARAYGELGTVLMAAEYFTEAQIALRNAEALAPGEFRWSYYLGHLYRRTGEAAKTTAAFERAVRADDSYVPAFVWLGNAYLDEGRVDAADPLFQKALDRDPAMVTALLGRGRVALARRDYTSAITWFERALAIDPDAGPVHVSLALAYRGAGQPDKAQRHLQSPSATPLRPPDPVYDEIDLLLETPVAFELRGAKAMSEGRYRDAIDAFQRGVSLAPTEPALRHKLATALALDGNLPAALTTMRETVGRSPAFAKGHYSLGLLYLQAGEPRRAAGAFQEALRLEENYIEPRLQLAHLLRRTGQSPAALPHYVTLVALDPRLIEARFGYAMALIDTGQYLRARDQLTEAVQLFPGRPAFALALARILAAAPDPGVRDGARALALLRVQPEATQQTLEFGMITAMALAEVGRFDDAAALQREILAQLPGNADEAIRRRLREMLRLYEQRQSVRRPWAPDEPMELSEAS